MEKLEIFHQAVRREECRSAAVRIERVGLSKTLESGPAFSYTNNHIYEQIR